MTYIFQGFFTATNDDDLTSAVCREASARWPDAICRPIVTPFHGLGLCWTKDLSERSEKFAQLDEQLGPWTRRLADLTFVGIEAECFGGRCDYGGTVWKDGQMLWHEELTDEENGPLRRLLDYLGVGTESGYFAPFTRGYFDSINPTDDQ